MIKLLVYSNELMSLSKIYCVEAAKKHGADIVYEYSPYQIDKNFYTNNKEVLDNKRGNGFWLWKPYFINFAISHCDDTDILVYCDAGVEIIHDLNAIIPYMDQDIFIFSNGLQHADWCKADVMQAINGAMIDHSIEQVQASVIFFKVTDYCRKFIKEWLLWCQMPGFIDDSPSVLPNHAGFREHRDDQAILTCMAVREGIRQHYWADALWFSTQRHRWPGDNYPLMFNHLRKRNNDW